MRFLKALWLMIFFFFAVLFLIQNNDVLSQQMTLKLDFYYFDYIWTNTAVPFFFVILVAFVAGALVTLGYLVMDRIRLKMELGRCRRLVRQQETELKKLRAIPLDPAPIAELPGAEKIDAA